MNKSLLGSLNSCGMLFFAKHYENLVNKSVSNQEIIKSLVDKEGYASSSARTMTSQGMFIINNLLGINALKAITVSTMTSKETRYQAYALLDKYNQ